LGTRPQCKEKWEDCTIDLCKDPFGRTGDLPVSRYRKAGSASTQIGVFRPANAHWYLDLNGNWRFDKGSTDAKLGPFGASTSPPVVDDWAGSGKTKIGILNPATGMWQIDVNGNGIFDDCASDACVGPFGQQGDRPVAGKWMVGLIQPARQVGRYSACRYMRISPNTDAIRLQLQQFDVVLRTSILAVTV
jgi:hypothetical protein